MARPEQPIMHQPDGPQEKCGVTGVFSINGAPISPIIPLLQEKLHHRGRDSSGMAVFNRSSGEIVIHKGEGSTRKVFGIEPLTDGSLEMSFNFSELNLLSDVGIGHNRYGTSGAEHKDNNSDGAQPMFAAWEGRKVAVSFNGNLPDSERQKLQVKIPPEMQRGLFDTNDIVQAIVSAPGDTWSERIVNGMEGVDGAYSLTILPDDGNLYGLRGPSGHWPLWMKREGDLYMLSSESVVSPGDGWEEINAGELVKISRDGVTRTQVYESNEAICSTHAAYMAHPDSMMTKEETYKDFRRRLGAKLAEEQPIDADIYTYTPTSSRYLAEGYTKALGVELTEVFDLLGKAERSYISHNKQAAERIIKGKIGVNREIVEKGILDGKIVVNLDDSQIKGSTALTSNTLLLDAGAAGVIDAYGTPVFNDNCHYGMVILKDLLIRYELQSDGTYRKRSSQEVAGLVNAIDIRHISEEGFREVFGKRNICMACMNGEHPFHRANEANSIPVFSRADARQELAMVGD